LGEGDYFFSEDAMNVIKLTLVAATLSLGLTASSVALPVDRLGALVQEHGVQADQVRTVCNQWGRCWWVPGRRYYGGYGFYGPRRYYGGYGYGRYRRW